MTKPKTLEQLRAEKERAETQLAQEQHKLERLENRKKFLEQGERKKRTHRLCNLGGTIESLAPEVKDLTRTEMTELIRPVVHVSSVNDELLSAVGKLTAEYGRIGGNLNQIARYLNEYGAPYNALSGEVRAAIADLAALKYGVLKKVGDAVGNTQTFRL